MIVQSSRYEAQKMGEKRYMSDKPCKRGHIGLKDTKTNTCIECRNIKARERYYADAEKTKKITKEKYIRNAEKIKEKRKQTYILNIEKERAIARVRSAEWRKLNPSHEGVKLAKKKYKQNNIGKVNSSTAKRRAAKLQRTPKWLTSDDKWMIEQAYELAVLRKKMFGFDWHVDHVIPLQGEIVSGLHVPTNLQVIPGRENESKSNKFFIT